MQEDAKDMNPKPTAVRLLEKSESSEAGRMLAKAFEDDPLWVASIPDPIGRPAALEAMFEAVIRATLAAHGLVETTSPEEAVAVWLSPGRRIGFWAMVKSGFALPRITMGMDPEDRKHMLDVLAQLDERRKALVPRPHWYLSAIGVDPEQQGRGLGPALLSSGIQRAESEDVPVYLETDTEANVAFYERHEFEVVEEITTVGLDVPIWLMIRRPKA